MSQRGAGDQPAAGAGQVEAPAEMPAQRTQGTPPRNGAAEPTQSMVPNEAPARSPSGDAVPGPRAADGTAEVVPPGDDGQPTQAAAVAGLVAMTRTATVPDTADRGAGPTADPGTWVDPGLDLAAGRAAEPARQAAAGPRPASWQRRLIGYLIDSLIIFAVTSALWIRLFISFGNRMSNTLSAHPHTGTATAQAAIGRVFSTTLGPFLVELVFTMVLAVLYYWVLTANWGTTVGKRCVSAWVVPAAGGTRPGLGASFLRALVFVVCAPILPLFLIDNLWLLAGRRRQCLHDKAARTIVVRGKPAP